MFRLRVAWPLNSDSVRVQQDAAACCSAISVLLSAAQPPLCSAPVAKEAWPDLPCPPKVLTASRHESENNAQNVARHLLSHEKKDENELNYCSLAGIAQFCSSVVAPSHESIDEQLFATYRRHSFWERLIRWLK